MTDLSAKGTNVEWSVEGVPIRGTWYEPTGEPPYAAVILAHGFGGVVHPVLTKYAQHFQATGLAALTFDYRSFGRSGGEPRQILNIEAQHTDWRSAIDWVRARPDVDAPRVGLWGTSFSGGHVQHLAASDTKVAAVVAQAPFCDGRADEGELWQSARLVYASLRDRLRALLNFEPLYIGLVGHPGDLAVMTSSDALLGVRDEPEDSLWENRVAARVLLDAANYRPGLEASKIRCPIHYDLPARDVVTPVKPIEEAAARAPHGELARWDATHFEVYWEPWFSKIAAKQAAFFVTHLGVQTSSQQEVKPQREEVSA